MEKRIQTDRKRFGLHIMSMGKFCLRVNYTRGYLMMLLARARDGPGLMAMEVLDQATTEAMGRCLPTIGEGSSSRP